MRAYISSVRPAISRAYHWGLRVARGNLLLLEWLILSFMAVALILGHVRFGLPVWLLPTNAFVQVLAVSMAFLCQALVLAVVIRHPRWRALLAIAVANVACFGLAYLIVLLRPGAEASRLFFLTTAACSAVLSALPLVSNRRYIHWLSVLLSVALFFELALSAQTVTEIAKAAQAPKIQTISTTVHRLSVTYYPVAVHPNRATTAGGALVALDDDAFLLVTGEGEFYQLSWAADRSLRSVRLPFSLPLHPRIQHPNFQPPLLTIRVTGMAIQPMASSARLVVVHDNWNPRKQCFTTRVSSIEVATDPRQPVKPVTGWSTLFESKPCLALTPGFDNLQSGGRIAFLPDGKLLLTLGDHGINGLNSPALAQLSHADYGKLLVLDSHGGRSELSRGHRNPQGLYIDAEARVWETEHGPRGGDELNLIAAGGNYGWPLVTYGAEYGYETWPLSSSGSRDHDSFVEPLFAFVPSIGISNLIELKGARFERWAGDLLMGSLLAQSLFRVRLRDNTVEYVERISVDRRVRDLLQAKDGRILLWTDEDEVAVVDVAATPSVYERCSSCHEPAAGMRASAPSLRNVVGREIASDFEYAYSPGLARIEGTWTESNLDAFIRSPSAFAPGTKMIFPGIADPQERAAIIEFLKEYGGELKP